MLCLSICLLISSASIHIIDLGAIDNQEVIVSGNTSTSGVFVSFPAVSQETELCESCSSSGVSSGSSPQIWYRFSVNSARSVFAASTCSENTTFDTVLVLLRDEDLSVVTVNDDSRSSCISDVLDDASSSSLFSLSSDVEAACEIQSTSSSVGCTALPAGTYIIVVGGFSENKGSFDLYIGAFESSITESCIERIEEVTLIETSACFLELIQAQKLARPQEPGHDESTSDQEMEATGLSLKQIELDTLFVCANSKPDSICCDQLQNATLDKCDAALASSGNGDKQRGEGEPPPIQLCVYNPSSLRQYYFEKCVGDSIELGLITSSVSVKGSNEFSQSFFEFGTRVDESACLTECNDELGDHGNVSA